MTLSFFGVILSPGTTYSCGKKSTKHSYRIEGTLGLKVSCIGIFVRYMCAREIPETQELRVIILDFLSPLFFYDV